MMSYKDKIMTLRWFLTASESQVLDLFSEEKDSVRHHEFVWIPGTREPDSRVLFVAHADTVRSSDLADRDLYHNRGTNKMYSMDKDCLGADDRAGCALLWTLAESGHGILVTTGEESGGKGAEAALRLIGFELTEYAMMIEPDRYGDNQYVFYSGTSNDAFESYLKDKLPPRWHSGWGSFTDISILSPGLSICGVNLSIGYDSQHTQYESLDVSAWLQIHDMVHDLYMPDDLDIPKFGAPDNDRAWHSSGKSITSYYGGYRGGWSDDELDDWYGTKSNNVSWYEREQSILELAHTREDVPVTDYDMVNLRDQILSAKQTILSNDFTDDQIITLAVDFGWCCKDSDDDDLLDIDIWWDCGPDEEDDEAQLRLAFWMYQNPLEQLSKRTMQLVYLAYQVLSGEVSDDDIVRTKSRGTSVYLGADEAWAEHELADDTGWLPLVNAGGDIVGWTEISGVSEDDIRRGYVTT